MSTNLTKAETLVRDIVNRKAIGAFRIGHLFSSMVDRYGESTETIDGRGYGLSGESKISNYDEIQVWCNAIGVIDRVFFGSDTTTPACSNANFINDMKDYRAMLMGCDISVFERCFGSGTKPLQVSDLTHLSYQLNGMEVFGIFMPKGACWDGPRDVPGPHLLRKLRINDEMSQ